MLLFIYSIMNTLMNCKVFPFVTSSSCTEPPNEKRFETYRRKDKILNSTLLYLRSTWNFPFKDECANLMSSSTLGIHGFVDLIFSIKITRIILSGNKKGLFVFTFPVVTVGAVIPVERPSWCSPPHSKAVLPPVVAPSLQAVQDRQWLEAPQLLHVPGLLAAVHSTAAAVQAGRLLPERVSLRCVRGGGTPGRGT